MLKEVTEGFPAQIPDQAEVSLCKAPNPPLLHLLHSLHALAHTDNTQYSGSSYRQLPATDT